LYVGVYIYIIEINTHIVQYFYCFILLIKKVTARIGSLTIKKKNEPLHFLDFYYY